MFIELVNNIASLIALSMIYGLIMLKYPQDRLSGKLLSGSCSASRPCRMTYPLFSRRGVFTKVYLCATRAFSAMVSAVGAALITVRTAFSRAEAAR
jgi:hypothetical protein